MSYNIRRQMKAELKKNSSNIGLGETKSVENFINSFRPTVANNAQAQVSFLDELTQLFADRKLELNSKTVPEGEYSDGTNKNNVEIGKLDRCSDAFRLTRYVIDPAAKRNIVYRILIAIFGTRKAGVIVKNSMGKNKGIKYQRIVLEDVLAGVDMVVVNEVIAKAWINSIGCCDINDISNIDLILEDVDVIFRFYIETGIDSSKKMYKIWMSLYQTYIRPNLGLNVNFYGNLKTDSPFEAKLPVKSAPSNTIGAIKKIEEGKKYMYNDPVNYYRMDVANKLAAKCNDMLPALYSSCEYVYVNNNGVEVDYDNTCPNYLLHKDMYSFLARYRNAMSSYQTNLKLIRNKLGNFDITSEEYDSLKKVITATFKNSIKAIEAEMLLLCKIAGLDDIEIGKTLVLVGHLASGGRTLNALADNKFAMTVLPEYTVKYLLSEYGADESYCEYIPIGYHVQTYSKKLPIEVKGGDIVEFVNGVSIENNVKLIKSRFSGNLIIYENFEIELDSIEMKDNMVDESKLEYRKVMYAVEKAEIPEYDLECENVKVTCKLDFASYELLSKAADVAIKVRTAKDGSQFLALTTKIDYVEYYIGSLFCNSEQRKKMLMGTIGDIIELGEYELYTNICIAYGCKLHKDDIIIDDDLYANRASFNDNVITKEDIDLYDSTSDIDFSDEDLDDFMNMVDAGLTD